MPTFSFKRMRLNVSSVKQRPFCPGLNVDQDLLTATDAWWWSRSSKTAIPARPEESCRNWRTAWYVSRSVVLWLPWETRASLPLTETWLLNHCTMCQWIKRSITDHENLFPGANCYRCWWRQMLIVKPLTLFFRRSLSVHLYWANRSEIIFICYLWLHFRRNPESHCQKVFNR